MLLKSIYKIIRKNASYVVVNLMRFYATSIPLSIEETVKTIITFETPSGTKWRATTDSRHFIPNFFITVNEVNVNAKINGM